MSKLLVATDGPANTLVITSLIDGAHVAGDLTMTVAASTTLTAADSALANGNDSTITGGTNNDVIIVLSTNVESNNTVVYDAASFGNDTIVNFAAGAVANADVLDFSGLMTANRAITVSANGANATAAAAVIAANAIEDTTASHDIYVSVNTAGNIGSVYQIIDGAGADDAVATLMGTINLADTQWSTLVAGNFA